jgi:hypothetical protein
MARPSGVRLSRSARARDRKYGKGRTRCQAEGPHTPRRERNAVETAPSDSSWRQAPRRRFTPSLRHQRSRTAWNMRVSTALSRPSLIRMRSQVQVQPGHHDDHRSQRCWRRARSAFDWLSRAQAARPSSPARSLLRPLGRQTPRPPRTVRTHPARDGSHSAGARTSRHHPSPRSAGSLR